MTRIIFSASLIVALILVSSVTFAQPAPPAPPAPVPLDGGLGLLALAGAGFAAKKLRKKR